jgi:hypothetical protein
MPGFVRTPKDEKKWSRAKEAAGESTPKDSESYWKLSNYIFHRMHKSEGGDESVPKRESVRKLWDFLRTVREK